MAAFVGEVGVGGRCAEANVDVVRHHPLLQRHHDRVVLVVRGAPDSGQRVDARELVDEPDEVAANSIALCQFWNANVVRHICQKLVVKKCRENISSIRRAPSACSDSASSPISSIRSLVLNPYAAASRISWPELMSSA